MVEPPTVEDPALLTFRTALMNAGQGRLEVRLVPVRPRKLRVTAGYDEDLVKWFRNMGQGYQARMNAVLRAYMLAVKSREIGSAGNRDWKGDEI